MEKKHKFDEDFIKNCDEDSDNGYILEVDVEYPKWCIIVEYTANDVKKCFDSSNHSEDDNRSIPRGMNKKVIRLTKHEVGGTIMIEFFALRPKKYSYLTDDNNNVKKAKRTEKICNKTNA